MPSLLSPLRRKLLNALTGGPEGRVDWIAEIGEGDDEGFFGPESAAWEVHAAMPTLVAGIRALLMQTLHPGAMAGVHDWSRYKSDPLGRLTGTIRWIVATTFGSTEMARRESARVSRFHDRVNGAYPAGGAEVTYSAHDPELLRWVHLAFTEAFLGCHETWGGPIPGGADGYVREWARPASWSAPATCRPPVPSCAHSWTTSGPAAFCGATSGWMRRCDSSGRRR